MNSMEKMTSPNLEAPQEKMMLDTFKSDFKTCLEMLSGELEQAQQHPR